MHSIRHRLLLTWLWSFLSLWESGCCDVVMRCTQSSDYHHMQSFFISVFVHHAYVIGPVRVSETWSLKFHFQFRVKVNWNIKSPATTSFNNQANILSGDEVKCEAFKNWMFIGTWMYFYDITSYAYRIRKCLCIPDWRYSCHVVTASRRPQKLNCRTKKHVSRDLEICF